MDELKKTSGSWSTTTAYLVLMAAGLLVIQVILFFVTLSARSEDQYYLALADRTRLATTLHQIFSPLSPESRAELVDRLVFTTFYIEIANELSFEQGDDENSLFFSRLIQRMLGRHLLLDATAETPEVYTLIRNFEVDLTIFPFFSRPTATSSLFDAVSATSLSHGQWLIINNTNISMVYNNMSWLLVELLAQFGLIMVLSLIVIRHVTKPLRGHFAKAGVGLFRTLREIRLEGTPTQEVGQALTVDMFKVGDKVKVTGTSLGKGFQGVMRRWNFAGQSNSHGAEKVHRSAGSVGMRTEPGRVLPGKNMAGHWGNERVTELNLEVLDVRPEDHVIMVKGSVPGPRNGLVLVRKQ